MSPGPDRSEIPHRRRHGASRAGRRAYRGGVTHPASDPSLAVAAALAALRNADQVPWSSDLAAAFRLRLEAAERLVVGVSHRVACAESAIARLVAVS